MDYSAASFECFVRRAALETAFGRLIIPEKKQCAPQRGRNDLKADTANRMSGLTIIAAAKEQAFLLAYSDCQSNLFYSAMEKRALNSTIQVFCVTISALFIFVRHGHLQHARVGREKSFSLPYIEYFIPSQVSFTENISFGNDLILSFHPERPI